MATGILPHCAHCGAAIEIFHPKGRRSYCSDACRLWAKVDMGDESSCWPYKGATTSRMGYGSTKYAGKTTGAHRVAYLSAVGEIPSGMLVCHKCDNPLCCNPKHLFLGTPLDNMRDMIAKGRRVGPTEEEMSRFVAMRRTPEFEEKRRLASIGRRWKVAKR